MRKLKQLGERIRIARSRDGLSQGEFAKLMNVSQPSVCEWEKSRSYPDAESIRKICVECGVSADWLLGIVD